MKKLEGTDYTYAENASRVNLWQFKQVIETGDVRYLLVLDDYEELPDVDTSTLVTVWFDIYSDFSEVTGGGEATLMLTKYKNIIYMEYQYNSEARLLNMLDKMRLPEMVEAIAEIGYFIDLKNYDKTFAKARSKLVRLKNQLNSDKKKRAAEKEEEKNTDFDSLITTLEKHQGYQFIEHKMSVKKFANIYKQYKACQTK